MTSMGSAIETARALGRQSPQTGHFGAELSTNLRQQEHRERYQRCFVRLTSIYYHMVARTEREKLGRSHHEFYHPSPFQRTEDPPHSPSVPPE